MEYGISEVRKVKSYKDHRLKGKRKHQRSVRLSYQWRAIYTEGNDGEIEIITVEEISPHEYRTK